jgi:hypothetical protein
MPGTEPPERMKREIEELLDQLDTFVPEERLAAKIRNRRTRQAVETATPSLWSRFTARLSRITLGQVMLAGLACLAIAYFFRGPLGGAATWVMLLGLILTIGAFALSVIRGTGAGAPVSGRVQKRWRGQIIEYSDPTPSAMDRVRAWWRRRGRR